MYCMIVLFYSIAFSNQIEDTFGVKLSYYGLLSIISFTFDHKLLFRDWDAQCAKPILLRDFLHLVTEFDLYFFIFWICLSCLTCQSLIKSHFFFQINWLCGTYKILTDLIVGKSQFLMSFLKIMSGYTFFIFWKRTRNRKVESIKWFG